MNYNKKNKIKKKLIDEYKSLSNFYVKYSKKKEKKQNEFTNKNVIKNKKTGQKYFLKTDYKSYLKDYFNTIIQRLIYNKKKSVEKDLVPFFITFTLPSKFHPFRTFNKKNIDKWEINPNFSFDTIKESVMEGYKELNLIFRYFYNYLKTNNRKYRKDLKNKVYYNLIFEYHKSFVPHVHFVIYLPKNYDVWINKVYLKTIEKWGLNLKSNKIIKIENKKNENGKLDKLDGSVLYISKYISKSLKKLFEIPNDLESLEGFIDNKKFKDFKLRETELYKFIGWKSYHKIRIYRGNNTKIGIKNYKKIYHTLEKTEKEKIINNVKNNNSCLLYEIEKNICRYTKIIDIKTKKEKKKQYKKGNKWEIYEVKEKIKRVNYYEINELFKIFDFYDRTHKSFFTLRLGLKNSSEYDTFIKFEKEIKEYRREYNFITKYILNLDLENRKQINKIMNYEENIIFKDSLMEKLNKMSNKFEYFKKFIKRFTEHYNYFLKDIKTKKIEYRFKKEIEVEMEIKEYYKKYKKWIDSNLSFSGLFFRTNYKVIKYKIIKEQKEIYNKEDFEMCPVIIF